MIKTRIIPTGDTSLQVEAEGGIDIKSSIYLRELKLAVDESHTPGIVETVCTYRTLMIHYLPEYMRYDQLCATLQELMAGSIQADPEPSGAREVLEIPVLYGGEYGPDIGDVAKHEGLTEKEVAQKHALNDNYVYFIGFAPGHPYAGSEFPTFTVPRLLSPRVVIPKGAVVVWESQTGVYGADLPSGWSIIGRTPLDIYNKDSAQPFLLHAGQWIHFRPIDEAEFKAIQKQVREGSYVCTFRKGGANA